MKILILGAGKMGSFFSDLICFEHEIAVYDIDPQRMRFLYNTQRFSKLKEIQDFQPELVINAVSLRHTISVFKTVLPYLPENCILSDIASVKTNLKDFYKTTGRPFVSTHPMFGPTFANLGRLEHENAIIITEGDHMGRIFFKDLYSRLGLCISEYNFEEHDQTMAYCLSIPFTSTFVFAAVMKHQQAPGTTFKRHLSIAKGVLSEDDTLLREVLFNPNSGQQLKLICQQLQNLSEIIKNKDEASFNEYLKKIREHITT